MQQTRAHVFETWKGAAPCQMHLVEMFEISNEHISHMFPCFAYRDLNWQIHFIFLTYFLCFAGRDSPCLRVYKYKFKQPLPTGPLGSSSLYPFLCLFLQQAGSESSARDKNRCPLSTPACVSACPIAFTFTCNLGAYAGPFFCILCVCLEYV